MTAHLKVCPFKAARNEFFLEHLKVCPFKAARAEFFSRRTLRVRLQSCLAASFSEAWLVDQAFQRLMHQREAARPDRHHGNG